MKKEMILVFLTLTLVLSLPSLLAVNLIVEKTSSNEVWISELDRPVSFDLKITNLGSSDSFSFYNLLGFKMFPIGTTPIANQEVKDIKLEVSPLAKLPENGFYTFPYYIRGAGGSEISQNLTFKIVSLDGAFEVGSADVDIQSQSIEIYIKNRENFNFGEVNAVFKSPFFELEKGFTLGPYETKKFAVQLNNEDFRSLLAGFYTMNVDVSVGGKKTEVEGTIKFVEKNLVITTKKDFGFFVHTSTTEKKNDGNTVEHSETVIKKNIISRLFTSFSPEPDLVERDGAAVYYTWTRDINPGEKFDITVKTNWLFPFLIILFLVGVVALVRKYSESSLILRKKVSFVSAKGGEFALKVTVIVSSRRYLERVNVVDRLPPLVKLYDRFGGDKPSKRDEANRRLEWNFERLSPGEKRVLSYVIYSKVGVFGKFALPPATGIFEKNGEIHETESNRAFFVTEQRAKRDDE